MHSTPRFTLTSPWAGMEDCCHSKGPGVQSSSAWQLQFLILYHLYNLLLQSLLSLIGTWNSPLAQPSPSVMMLHSSFVPPATRTFVFFTLSFRCRFFPNLIDTLGKLLNWFLGSFNQSPIICIPQVGCGCSFYSDAIRWYFWISHSLFCVCNKQM